LCICDIEMYHISGSGYKEALNLVTTSDLYNREVMMSAENNIKSDLRDVEEDVKASNSDDYISFDMTVTARYHELVGNDLVNALKKTNGGMEKKDVDGVYELFKKSSQPKLCEGVTYKVDAIYLNGRTKIANTVKPQSIGPDLTLKGIVISS